MTAPAIPDELVQAVIEAMHIRSIHGECQCGYKTIDPMKSKEHNARIALQATFAKLPECETVRKAVALGVERLWDYEHRPNGPSAYAIKYADAALAALAALAREFGGSDG